MLYNIVKQIVQEGTAMSQEEKKKLVSIKTDDTLMETALHGTHLFPYKLYDDNITDYDFNCIDWHWHTEFEFVYIESGIVHFNVGEDNFDMSEGQGIFINSKVVHKMHSENDAVIPNFLFLPSLIAPKESLIYQKFVLPFLNSSLGYYIFSSSQEWQKEILSEMQKLIQFSRGEINELQISVQLQKIWALITSNVICYPETQNVNSSSLARLQMMMQFIHSKMQSILQQVLMMSCTWQKFLFNTNNLEQQEKLFTKH